MSWYWYYSVTVLLLFACLSCWICICRRKSYFGALVGVNMMVSGAYMRLRAHVDTDADVCFELCDDVGDDIYVGA